MNIRQQQDVKEIISFVEDKRKKQTDEILNFWIQSAQKHTHKRSLAK